MSRPKYIVEYGISKAVPNCNTVEELREYLNEVPHFDYRLVTCQLENGSFLMVWELRDEYWNE